MKKFVVPFILFIFTVLNISCSNIQAAHHPDKYQVIEKLKNSSIVFVDKNGEGATFPFCSGVWISETTMLTALHCAKGYADAQAEAQMTPEQQLLALLFGEASSPVGIYLPYAIESDIIGIGENPKKTYQAKVISIDKEHDLAMLSATSIMPMHDWLHVHEYMPTVGDDVLIEGNQMGLFFTTMPGMISAIRETIPENEDNIHGPIIQVHSAIWKGNSGGPVVSEQGELLGIVSFTLGAPNQGFAIACPQIKKFIIKTYIESNQIN